MEKPQITFAEEEEEPAFYEEKEESVDELEEEIHSLARKIMENERCKRVEQI